MPRATRRGLLRAAVRIAGALAVGGAVAGCGQEVPARGGRSGRTLTMLAPQALAPAAQALGQAYGAATGGTVVVRVALPSVSEALSAMLTGTPGAGADLVLTTPAVRGMQYASTLMENLGPALAASGLRPGLYPQLLVTGQYGGPNGPRQMILPVFRDPKVTFYNSDAFARAGVDPPAPDWSDWTLDRLQLVCQSLQQSAHSIGLVAPLANATNIPDLELLCAFVRGFGGATVEPSGAGYKPQFASQPGAVLGITQLVGLHPYEPANPTALPDFDPSQPDALPLKLFSSGQAAIYFGHHADVAPLQAAIGQAFAWNVAPLPRFPIHRAQPVAANGLAVLALSANPGSQSDAVTLALYACSPAGQAAMAKSAVGVPALGALGASPLWRSGTPGLFDDVFVADSADDLVVPEPLHFLPALTDAVRAIVLGTPAYTALQQAATASQYTLATWNA